MASTRTSLSEPERLGVYVTLVCVLEDDAAAEEWELATMASDESPSR
jgi:hypothetical protein